MYDALYARQSIEKKDSISVESQLEYCRYETHGEACIEYTDRGFSGKDTNRPGFEKMMNDIRAGKIKRVIVYKLDRISRSILDFANMMEIFQNYVRCKRGFYMGGRIPYGYRLTQIEEEIEVLLSKVSGEIGVLMKYIDEKISELDTERKALQKEIVTANVTDTEGRLKQIINHVKAWETLSFEDRQAVVDTLVKVIHIADGNIEITWNI